MERCGVPGTSSARDAHGVVLINLDELDHLPRARHSPVVEQAPKRPCVGT